MRIFRPKNPTDPKYGVIDLDRPGMYSDFYITYSWDRRKKILARKTFSAVETEWEDIAIVNKEEEGMLKAFSVKEWGK